LYTGRSGQVLVAASDCVGAAAPLHMRSRLRERYAGGTAGEASPQPAECTRQSAKSARWPAACNITGRTSRDDTMTTRPNAKVLVVDDEEVVRRSHLRVLTSVSCDVEAVNDGEQALAAMEAKPYDLVLLDLRMPGIDGMMVLRTMKERWPESEVIVITGYPSFESAKEAVRLGAFQYLAKPLAPGEVIEVAHGALEHKHWSLRRQATEELASGAALDGGAER
jgi:CheY-like chemotaxis protein